MQASFRPMPNTFGISICLVVVSEKQTVRSADPKPQRGAIRQAAKRRVDTRDAHGQPCLPWRIQISPRLETWQGSQYRSEPVPRASRDGVYCVGPYAERRSPNEPEQRINEVHAKNDGGLEPEIHHELGEAG